MRASCDSDDQCQQQCDANQNRFFLYHRGEVLFNMFPFDETVLVLGGKLPEQLVVAAVSYLITPSLLVMREFPCTLKQNSILSNFISFLKNNAIIND